MKKLAQVAVVLAAVDKFSAVIDKAVNGAITKLSKMQKKYNELGDKAFSVGKKLFIGAAMIAAPLIAGIQAAEEAQVAFNRLDQVFRSMGETTGEVAKEAADFASKLQFQIGAEDENIMLVQAKLATFQNVMSKTARDAGVFNKATELAFDLQAAGFGDAAGNAVQLGKAINDPIKGIKALTKSGITFTQAEQDKIKELVKTGHLLEAQQMVIAAIDKQVGGVAKSTVTSTAKMKLVWGEIMEAIGGVLLPVMEKLSNFLTQTLFPAFKRWQENNPVLFSSLVKVAGILAIVLAAAGTGAFIFGGLMKTISTTAQVIGLFSKTGTIATAVQWAMNAAAAANPYVLLAMAIIVVIAAIVLLMVKWKQAYGWWQKQSTGVKILVVALMAIASPILLIVALVRLLIDNWGMVRKKFEQFLSWFRGWGKFILLPLAPFLAIPLLIVAYWGRIKTFFIGLWSFVKALFVAHVQFIMSIPRMIMDRWNFMINFYRNLWDNIKNIFMGAVNWIFGLHTRMFNAGMNIMNSLWEGIKSTVNKPIDAIKNVTDQIRDYFPFSPAKRGALKDIHRVRLMETVAQSVNANPVLNAVGNATNAIATAKGLKIPQLQPALATINGSNNLPINKGAGGVGGAPMSYSYNPTVNLTVNGGTDDPEGMKDLFLSLLNKHGAEVLKMIERALANQKRKEF